jgi:hypothetical protein
MRMLNNKKDQRNAEMHPMGDYRLKMQLLFELRKAILIKRINDDLFETLVCAEYYFTI